jgi:isocitrate dehydrogenase (NAD+)
MRGCQERGRRDHALGVSDANQQCPRERRAASVVGRGIANPTAVILSGVLMLRYLNENAAADRIENAVRAVFTRGDVRTGDLGGKATTDEFVESVLAALG